MEMNLVQTLKELTRVLNKLDQRFDVQEAEWLDPDASCQFLGIKLTRSGSHRRRLKNLERRGFLTNVRNGKPKMYPKDQLAVIAAKMKEGKIIV